ncbi:hypothetical protein ACFQ34_10240, partial [Pseudonocardia benzenivorans]
MPLGIVAVVAPCVPTVVPAVVTAAAGPAAVVVATRPVPVPGAARFAPVGPRTVGVLPTGRPARRPAVTVVTGPALRRCRRLVAHSAVVGRRGVAN